MEASLSISNSKHMRKYLLFVGYIISVAILFFAMDLGAGALFDKYLFLKKDTKMMHVYGDKSEELVILGASRAAHHYIPAVLEDSLGLTCYNYGMDGRNIFNQYVVASELLNKPQGGAKVVILEVAYIDVEDSPGWNDEKLSNLYILYKKDANVKEIIDGGNKSTGLALQYCNFFRYNSSMLSYIRQVMSKGQIEDTRGYEPLTAVWNKDVETLENDVNPSFHPQKEKYLRALIEECKNKGVKLILYNSPDYRYFENHLVWEDRITDICKEYGIPFVNHEHDTIFMSHKDWFNEPFHLNDEGAKAYSSLVAEEIKDYITTN